MRGQCHDALEDPETLHLGLRDSEKPSCEHAHACQVYVMAKREAHNFMKPKKKYRRTL